MGAKRQGSHTVSRAGTRGAVLCPGERASFVSRSLLHRLPKNLDAYRLTVHVQNLPPRCGKSVASFLQNERRDLDWRYLSLLGPESTRAFETLPEVRGWR
jgi:hypothetical protein